MQFLEQPFSHCPRFIFFSPGLGQRKIGFSDCSCLFTVAGDELGTRGVQQQQRNCAFAPPVLSTVKIIIDRTPHDVSATFELNQRTFTPEYRFMLFNERCSKP